MHPRFIFKVPCLNYQSNIHQPQSSRLWESVIRVKIIKIVCCKFRVVASYKPHLPPILLTSTFFTDLSFDCHLHHNCLIKVVEVLFSDGQLRLSNHLLVFHGPAFSICTFHTILDLLPDNFGNGFRLRWCIGGNLVNHKINSISPCWMFPACRMLIPNKGVYCTNILFIPLNFKDVLEFMWYRMLGRSLQSIPWKLNLKLRMLQKEVECIDHFLMHRFPPWQGDSSLFQTWVGYKNHFLQAFWLTGWSHHYQQLQTDSFSWFA